MAIENVPLKLASVTPEITTACPTTKLCVAVVVMVTVFDARTAPLAAMVAVAGGGSAAGAVYNPPVVIVPKVAFPPSTSFTNHFTLTLKTDPLPLVASAPVCEYVKVVVEGTEAMMKVPLKLVSVTPEITTVCPWVRPWGEVVVIVTMLEARTAPLEAAIVATLAVPVTLAANCCVPVTTTLTMVGLMATVTPPGGGLLPPPQPATSRPNKTARQLTDPQSLR